ncbi:MAG TPA: SPFH domain-containing protein [Planctomycetes bacterium]|nr:SPFH domain-containing protein [Planctomycetota bacterium]
MTEQARSTETPFSPLSGWLVLGGLLVFEVLSVASLVARKPPEEQIAIQVIASILLLVLFLPGFFVVGPNMSRALVLFGNYRGTVRRQGFFWTNPFTSKRTVSLKANNVASEIIKVNDQGGNPIEIGAVVVWQVEDTAQALFDVEDYVKYVDIQIETAVRQVASTHPYDGKEDEEEIVSLRGDGAVVAGELEVELKKRLHRAGIEVLEARLSHLAYAPEIASAMLQRQQAEAIIAARQKIVEGAVSMVEQALDDLGRRKVVELDDAHRAALVGNLLVVLCGQASPQPVVNAGSASP